MRSSASRSTRTRLPIAILLTATLCVTATACSTDKAPTAGTSAGVTGVTGDDITVTGTTPTESTDGSDGSPAASASSTIDLGPLTAAGIVIVPDESKSAANSPGHLVVTQVQAERLATGVAPGDGILGRDVDAVAPMPAGVPPTSYLVAAWVSAYDSPAAAAARAWMGDQDWQHAPDVRFPVAVLTMFVSEVAGTADAELPAASDPLDLTGLDGSALRSTGLVANGVRGEEPTARLIGPCSTVTGFVASAIGGLFNALRITPSSGTGVFDFLGGVLAAIWNTALGLAQGLVQGLIDVITAPVFEAIRLAVGALGVATLVMSYFTDQTLNVELAPVGSYRFAIGSEADIHGEFIARAKELTGDWPPFLLDCAQVAGASLPKLITAGSAATWTVSAGIDVIVPGSTTDPVQQDLTARLAFVTGHESDEQATGEQTSARTLAQVRIERPEIDAFLEFASAQVRGAQSSLLSRVPAGPLRDAANAAFSTVIDPVVNQIQGEVSNTVGGVFTLSGEQVIEVSFHMPPDTTTTATTVTTTPETTTPPDDFCSQFRDLVAWLAANQPGDVVPWANEIVSRLQKMRLVAPADLLDEVDVMLGVYEAVAASADILTLIERTEPLAAATTTLSAVCGV